MARAIAFRRITGTTLQARVTGLDSSYKANNRTITWEAYRDGVSYSDYETTESLNGQITSTPWVTLEDLYPTMDYIIKYTIVYYDGDTEYSISDEASVSTAMSDPEIHDITVDGLTGTIEIYNNNNISVDCEIHIGNNLWETSGTIRSFRSKTFDLEFPEPNTDYDISVYFYDPDGDYDYTYTFDSVTSGDGLREFDYAPDLDYILDDLDCTLQIINDNDVKVNYTIYINNGTGEGLSGTLRAGRSTEVNWTFAEYETIYDVRVVFSADGYYDIENEIEIETGAGPIRLDQPWTNVTDINGGQVELYIWNQNDVSVTYTVKVGTYVKATGVLAADESSYVYIHMDKLETKYECSIVFTKTGYLDSFPSTETFTTGTLEEWTWTNTELNAFNNQGTFNILTAERMNAFIGHVNTTGNAMKTFGWGTETFSITHFAEKGYPLYATDFHFLLTKIKLICTTVASKKGVTISYTVPNNTTQIVKGKEVYGSYFIDATNALNKAISYMK